MSAVLQSWAFVTLDETKSRLRIETEDWDHFLVGAINGASGMVNQFTKRKLKSATYTSETYSGDGTISLYLNEYPITTVTAVSIYDGTTTWSLTVADDIKIMNGDRKIEIYQNSTSSIPYRFLSGQENVTVTYTAGYLAGTHDQELAVIEDVVIDLVKRKYDAYKEGLVGAQSISYEGSSITYNLDDLLPGHKQALSPMVRVVV